MPAQNTYSPKEAKNTGLDVIAEIQSLDWNIDQERELRDEFMEENDMFMANETQNKITELEIRKGNLVDNLDEEAQREILEEKNVNRQPGDGATDFYIIKDK